MNRKYLIIGLLILIVLGLGCIGYTNSPTTKTNSDISSRLVASENSGIFSEVMKSGSNNCLNKAQKYSATYNDGDYLEIQWNNHPPCENNLSMVYYVSGNDSYNVIYDPYGNPNITTINGGVIPRDNEFVKSAQDISLDIIKKYNAGKLSNRDKEIFADFNNVSDVGKFVVKVSGTDGTRITGTINGMVDSYTPIKQIDDTIPKEFSVDNLKSLSLKKETVGLMIVEISKDNKLIFSNYVNNHDKLVLEYSSNPGYLREDMPAE